MFKKILIANRGEIACRIIKTARRLGISTVAVFSDADANALHVSMADEAINIGPPASRESYLVGEKIIAAAKQTGAEAIHPGYGFLSENDAFCDACKAEQLVFIGPPADAIRAMSSKSAAKTIMAAAGVPLVPGYHGENQDPGFLKKAASEMGYPVLLKAVAGGGGKGMRQVWSEREFDESLAAAKREALSSFGDDDMLVEKYLTEPRHVEIQVFCDQHGNAVYLAERDCSIQRRHQKIIEEAPAPGLNPDLRRNMGETAIQSARAINYQGAGTIEFLLNSDGSFYFMEMNTRLQVEHPVTEMITGQDLVEWQLRVASGEPLPLTQDQVKISGHAFEARIYAEDPENDFLPVTGHLAFLQPPQESSHVRVDTGVLQGDEVSIYYDPMIAKLVVWDENREKALLRLAKALSEYRISGLTTNLGFLYNLATSAPFRAADLDTGFIEKHRNLIFHDNEKDIINDIVLGVLCLVLEQKHQASQKAGTSSDPFSPWNDANSWRLNEAHIHRFSLSLHNREYPVSVEYIGQGEAVRYSITVMEKTFLAQGRLDGNSLYSDIDGYRQHARIAEHKGVYSIYTQTSALQFSLAKMDFIEVDTEDSGGKVVSPMNGTIVSLLAEPGEIVAQGDGLMIMEAMKMEYTIKAPANGKVIEFYYAPGELVEGNEELLSFEAESD